MRYALYATAIRSRHRTTPHGSVGSRQLARAVRYGSVCADGSTAVPSRRRLSHHHIYSHDDAACAIHALIQLPHRTSSLGTRTLLMRAARDALCPLRHRGTEPTPHHPTLSCGVTERVCLRQKASNTARIQIVNVGVDEIEVSVNVYSKTESAGGTPFSCEKSF